MTLHFPEAMQHNFAPKCYTHYLELDQLSIEVKPYSSHYIFCKNTFCKHSEAQIAKKIKNNLTKTPGQMQATKKVY